MNLRANYDLNFPPLVYVNAQNQTEKLEDVILRCSSIRYALQTPEAIGSKRQIASLQREFNNLSLVISIAIELKDSDSENEVVPEPERGWSNPFPFGPKTFTTTQIVIGTALTIGVLAGAIWGFKSYMGWNKSSKSEKTNYDLLSSSENKKLPTSNSLSPKNENKDPQLKYTWDSDRSLYRAVKNFCKDKLFAMNSTKEGRAEIGQEKAKIHNEHDWIKEQLINDHSLEHLLKHNDISPLAYTIIMGEGHMHKHRSLKIDTDRVDLLKNNNIIIYQ